MGCKELDITSYFRLTEPPENPRSGEKLCTKKTAYSRFFPVVSVLVPNYRYYSPELGRWLSRDPIEELGGWNLYGMISNNPISFNDFLGLCKIGETRNVDCKVRVTAFLSTPDLDDSKDAFAEAIGDVAVIAAIGQAINNAGGVAKLTADAIAKIIAKTLLQNAITIDGGTIADLAKNAADLLRKKWNGYSLWTKITYERCDCWILGYGTWWWDEETDWMNHVNYSYYEAFSSRFEAYMRASSACEKHQKTLGL